MKFKFITLLLVIFITSGTMELFSQNPPCKPSYQGLTFEYLKPSVYPPLYTDMPYEVMIGYIAMDSICKNMILDSVDKFLKQQTFNDTIKYLKKVMYEMNDYNPILFDVSQFNHDTNYKIFGTDLVEYVKKSIHRTQSVDTKFDYNIISAAYIVHIKVTYTNLIYNNLAKLAKNQIIVTGKILDLIKGHYIPNCKYTGPSPIKRDEENKSLKKLPTTLNLIDSCIQFIYCLEWTRGKNYEEPFCTKHMVDENGLPLIKQDTEYIVFLRPILICETTSNYYYSLRPLDPYSEVYTMYPIIDGLVIDPGNDFGFGRGLSVEEFKNKLKSRINMILNF